MVAERRSSRNQRESGKSAPSRRQPARSINNNNENDVDEGNEVIDYAATADEFFANCDDDDENGEVVAEGDEDDDGDEDDNEIDEAEIDHGDEFDQEHIEGDEDDEYKEDDEDEEEEDDDDDEEDDEEEEANDDEDDDEEEEEEEDDAEKARQQQKVANAGNKFVIPGTEEPCTFDLRNLLAMSSYPIDSTQLYSKKGSSSKILATDAQTKNIILPQSSSVNEDYLLQKSVEGCNQMIAALWQLPVERSDAGPMVMLPTYDESKIPRKLVRSFFSLTRITCRPDYFLPQVCCFDNLTFIKINLF